MKAHQASGDVFKSASIFFKQKDMLVRELPETVSISLQYPKRLQTFCKILSTVYLLMLCLRPIENKSSKRENKKSGKQSRKLQ